jgi:hypothetical protein
VGAVSVGLASGLITLSVGQLLRPHCSFSSTAIQIAQQCGPFATYRRVSCPFASTICRLFRIFDRHALKPEIFCVTNSLALVKGIASGGRQCALLPPAWWSSRLVATAAENRLKFSAAKNCCKEKPRQRGRGEAGILVSRGHRDTNRTVLDLRSLHNSAISEIQWL